MTSADFCVFSNTLQYWLLLSERITQTSPGTTRFLLSIHLPHLSCMIPCSYGAMTCSAALPSCITSYVISVRQTRDLPMSSYIPHIQLPSDSTSQWTPLPSAISFPLPGGLGTCTLWKRAPPGAHEKKYGHTRTFYTVSLFILFLPLILPLADALHSLIPILQAVLHEVPVHPHLVFPVHPLHPVPG